MICSRRSELNAAIARQSGHAARRRHHHVRRGDFRNSPVLSREEKQLYERRLLGHQGASTACPWASRRKARRVGAVASVRLAGERSPNWRRSLGDLVGPVEGRPDTHEQLTALKAQDQQAAAATTTTTAPPTTTSPKKSGKSR